MHRQMKMIHKRMRSGKSRGESKLHEQMAQTLDIYSYCFASSLLIHAYGIWGGSL